MTPEQKPFSRRQLLKGAGAGGLAAALIPVLRQSEAPLGRLATFGSAPAAGTEGTPEQVHLTWGEDPTSSVVVSSKGGAGAREPPLRRAGHKERTWAAGQDVRRLGLSRCEANAVA